MVDALVVRAANAVGAVLLEDEPGSQWHNRIQIKSETSTRLYVVAQRRSSGEWACSCPSGITRKYCKHLTAMMPILLPATEKAKEIEGGK